MENDKKYWMKRRRYGWGWIPVTWQGWLVIVLQAGIVVIAATQLPAKPAEPTTNQLLTFFTIVILAVLTLIVISANTGPSPHWRWGKKDTDNPAEDF